MKKNKHIKFIASALSALMFCNSFGFTGAFATHSDSDILPDNEYLIDDSADTDAMLLDSGELEFTPTISKNTTYSLSYDDGKMFYKNYSGYGSTSKSGGSIVVETGTDASGNQNGYLKLKREKADGALEYGSQLFAAYYFNQSYLDTVIKKSASDVPVNIYIKSRVNKKISVNLLWDGDGKLYGKYRKSAEEASAMDSGWEYICDIEGLEAKFTLFVYMMLGTYSVKVNGEYAIKGAYTQDEEVYTEKCQQNVYINMPSGTTADAGDEIWVDYIDIGSISDHPAVVDSEKITISMLNGSDSNQVTKDLTLPQSGINGSQISWISSDESVIATDGKVTRPDAATSGDANVTLTAQITNWNYTVAKQFDFNVAATYTSDASKVNADFEWFEENISAITNQNYNAITDSLNFRFKPPYDSKIEFISDNEDVITNYGTVVLPKGSDKEVKVTARVCSGDYSKEKVLEFNVKADNTDKKTVSSVKKAHTLSNIPTYSLLYDDGIMFYKDYSGHGTLDESGGDVSVESEIDNDGNSNGYLKLKRSFESGNISYGSFLFASYPFDTRYMQTRIRKSSPEIPVNVYIKSRNNRKLSVNLLWDSDGKLYGRYRESADEPAIATKSWKYICDIEGTEAEITSVVYMLRGTYSLMVNGEYVLVGAYTQDEDVSTEKNQHTVYVSMPVSSVTQTGDEVWIDYINIGNISEHPAASDGNSITVNTLNGSDGSNVKQNLSLPDKGDAGSEIIWTSSNQNFISNDGKVTRPDAVSEGDAEVTMTARITNQNYTVTKEFQFKVLGTYNDDASKVEADFEYLEENISQITNQSYGAITDSLNFVFNTLYGSKISFASSDESVINKYGTVIRPRGEDKKVTLTITVSSGDVSKEKEIVLNVPADNTEIKSGKDSAESPVLSKIDTYSLSFNDNTMFYKNYDGYGTLDTSGGEITTISQTDENGDAVGYLNLKRSFSGGFVSYGSYLFGEWPFDQRYAETLIRKSSEDVAVHIYIKSRNNQKVSVNLLWDSDGKLYGKYRESDSGDDASSASWKYICDISGTEAKFTAIVYMLLGTYSLKVNDKYVLTGAYTQDTDVSTEKNQHTFYITMPVNNASDKDDEIWVDYLDIGNISAHPAVADEQWLTEEIITGEATNIVRNNILLPTEGANYSDITWESSDESVISTDGKVVRPDAIKDGDKNVTLTATINTLNYTVTKKFDFIVPGDYSDAKDKVSNDLEYITSHIELITPESLDKLTKSLNFNIKSLYGSKITFTSQNEDAITPLGRVIRPRYDEDAVTTTITVTVSYGNESASEDITVTVLPDEKFEEPDGFMSDEEFFGRYENGKWTVEPKLNYKEISELKDVESAAKSGDYSLARKYFLQYVKNDKVYSGNLSASIRNAIRASTYVDKIYESNGGGYLSGQFYASGNEWKQYSAPVASFTKSGSLTFVLMAWHNESAALEIKSKESGTSPYIEANVNGVVKKFYPTDDATIKAGKNAGIPQLNGDTLYARTFGDFMGDNIAQTVLRFDFTDVLSTDVVTDIKLVVTARVDSESDSKKRILVCTNSNAGWQENTVCWNNFSWLMYNFNGNDYNWENPAGASVEFYAQQNRFSGIQSAAYEYAYTKDEAYAYGLISAMLDWIEDKSTALPVSHYDGVWVGRGQYARSLDTCERIATWSWSIPALVSSRYMTEDAAVAIWKHMWDAMNATRMNHNKGAYNWQQNELMNLFSCSFKWPEFTDSMEWADYSNDTLLSLAITNVHPDGSYVEGSDSYASGALGDFMDHKQAAEDAGYEMGEEFDSMLQKFAWWQLMLEQPVGGFNGYGDSEMANNSLESSTAERFPNISKWYNDDEFRYVASYGLNGTKPEWTSKIWRDSGTSVLRSSWSREAMYIFTNVNGRSNHSHSDDNHIFFAAYGRQLLTDPGLYYNYGSKAIQSWGQTRSAHNTVSMGNGPNATIDQVGTIDDFITNSSIDFHSSTSVSHADYNQKRSILMVKPYYVIVSDYMMPTDTQRRATYYQNWHMLPQANISGDDENKTLRSNFESGANIVLANADDSNISFFDGYQGYNGIAMETKYGAFEVSGTGDVTIDTAFAPSRNDKTPELKAERINIGVETTTATALKITSDIDDSKHTGYYYLSYENNPQTVRTFDKYTSNGQLAFVDEDSEGSVKIASVAKANYIKKADKYLIYSDKRLSDLTISVQGTELVVQSSETDLGNIKFSDELDVLSISVNGVKTGIKVVDGYIVPGDDLPDDSDEINQNGNLIGGKEDSDKKDDDKDIDKKPGSQGGSGGGNSGGDSVIPVMPGNTPMQTNGYFSDVPQEHWAKAAIEELYSKGIVNGKSANVYAPEDNVTRAEFTTLIIRVLGTPVSDYANSYQDISSSDWYAGYVQTALELGIISADERFRPDDFITREEMAKIAVGVGMVGNMPTPEDTGLNFNDSDSISSWALPYVKKAVESGLVKGDDNGNFAPLKNLTRAESAMVIYRILTNGLNSR